MNEVMTIAGRKLIFPLQGERRAIIERAVIAIETETRALTETDLRMAWIDDAAARDREIAALRAALEDMVRQFAYWSNSAGGIYTGGLSALEEAFGVLGWDDPYPLPDRRCDEPGCMEDGTMGWPTRPGGTGLNGGYRTTCWDHSDIGKARAILAIINPEETP
jgi:hypothetical protein